MRALGAEGLGVFGLLYGGLVLATALATGLVGDALTVLDRQAERLQGRPAGRGVRDRAARRRRGHDRGRAHRVDPVADVAAPRGGDRGVHPRGAAAPAPDGVAAVLVGRRRRRDLPGGDRGVASSGRPSSARSRWRTCWGTVLVAQGAGLLMALRLLPDDERHLARWRPYDASSVLRFGSWRAAQQGVRPATLTLTRTVIVLATSTAAFGEIEAARVYTAPTMLVVGGVGGFLFAKNAADKHRPLPRAPAPHRHRRGRVVRAGAGVRGGGDRGAPVGGSPRHGR